MKSTLHSLALCCPPALLAAIGQQRARFLTGLGPPPPPEFFERLIVNLLVSMGYGGARADEAGRTLGRSGDDGVDGVIDQDPLGLDRF